MPAKSNLRNWNDVQTAIATAAIVTTLGLWNLFATPAKAETVKASEPVPPPPTEPPEVEVREVAPLIATPLPQVKIMFTPGASQTTIVPGQTNNQPAQTKKKKKKNNNDSGGSVSVTQTRTS
jgi:hypothetical protein